MGGIDTPLELYSDPGAFREQAVRYLAENEAANNLLLGILAQLAAHTRDAAPYLALCTGESGIEGAAIRTPPMHLLLAQGASRRALEELAADLLQRSPDLPGVLGERAAAAAFAELWRERTGRGHVLAVAERIYELTAVVPPPAASGRMRRAGAADEPLLRSWIRAFQEESGAVSADPGRSLAARLLVDPAQGGMHIWEDGEPVSLAGYSGPTPTGIRIGPVYTPPDLRGRGYATTLVAQLSQALLRRGLQRVFLFTNLANRTANDIYQRIGYRPVADADQLRFL